MATNFHISREQDATDCTWHQDFSAAPGRVVRLSVSQYPRGDALEEQSSAVWVHLKLFKKLDPSCYTTTDKIHGLRRTQQISLRPSEAERALMSMNDIRLNLVGVLYMQHQNIPTKQSVDGFNLTDFEDATTCHWYSDLFESVRRKLRVSYVMYNNKDPVKSTYVQFKLFVRKEETDQFTRKSMINMTLNEFRELADDSRQMGRQIIEHAFGRQVGNQEHNEDVGYVTN